MNMGGNMHRGESSRRDFVKTAGIAAAIVGAGPAAPRASGSPLSAVVKSSKHVLMISVDGIHAIDLARWVETHPTSVLALLSDKGVTYTQASCSRPSDSFPGLLALITGGSTRSTGIWYDFSFDRNLLPPGGGAPGTVMVYDESIDLNQDRLDGGVTPPRAVGNYAFAPGEGINTSALPLDPVTLAPVMPWQLLRVNTIFEVAKAHGRRTAWADKHVGAYQIVHGPSGHGVDDYFSPEINSLANQLEPGASDDFTKSHVAVKLYDALKVKAVVNQCRGRNSTGA